MRIKPILLSIVIAFFCSGSAFIVVDDFVSADQSEKKQNNIVFCGNFGSDYNTETWQKHWGIAWIDRTDECRLVEKGFSEGSASLRVSYPKGGVGPKETGCQFPIVFRNLEGENTGLYQEVYLRYYVKFEEGFDFNQGGKLPGLMGGGDSWACSGGHQPNGANGWTMRFMWRKDGKIVIYAYVPKSHNGKWGGIQWGQDLDCSFKAEPGKWHCIEEYINVGTPNHDDGILNVWIDGEKRLSLSDLCFWKENNDYGKIGGVYFSTFHGGNTPDWGPRNDSFVQFAAFTVSLKRLEYTDF